MKQRSKRSLALVMALAMVFSFASLFGACGEKKQHTCEHVCEVCGKCTSDCTDPVCADKCEGHEVVTHECGHVCPTCGKCLDETCTDSVCADKCEGHEAAHECGHVCPECGKCTDEACTDPVCADKCEGHEQVPSKDGDFTPITTPVAGKYYMGMKCSGDVYYYLKGGMSGYYMATSSNKDDAVIVDLIADGDGWLLKQGNQYMEIEISGTHVNAVYKSAQTAGKRWTWDSTYNIFTWENGAYFYGTYGSYNTIGGGNYAQHASDNYKAQLGTFGDQEVVQPDPASVTLDRGSECIILPWVDNNYLDIKATVLPANAPQDVTWSISENTAGITVDKGRVLCGKTEGEATVTATATGTDKSASVKIKVEAVNGSTEEDPLTVDEAIALMTEEGKEVAAGYSQNILWGFYLTGTVENSKYVSQSQDSYWTFDMAGSDSKKITCICRSNFGVSSADGKLDGYTVVLERAKLKLSGTTYTAGSVDDMAGSVSATPPAITSITIDETATVNMPVQTKINVTQVLPANAQLDGTEVWKTGDESKATVEGGMVTGVSAGEVKIWVEVGSVKSNECTVTVNAAASENKFTFDWTTKLTADSVADTVYDSAPSKRKNHLTDYLNAWTPGQTEITAVTFSQDIMISRDTTIGGFGFFPGVEAGTAQITTEHTIKKITFKIIALSYAEDIKLTVNNQQITHSKGDATYNGKLDSAFEITVELTEASKTINMSAEVVKGNAFIIVGMTLEW